jgi:hypothetical protein
MACYRNSFNFFISWTLKGDESKHSKKPRRKSVSELLACLQCRPSGLSYLGQLGWNRVEHCAKWHHCSPLAPNSIMRRQTNKQKCKLLLTASPTKRALKNPATAAVSSDYGGHSTPVADRHSKPGTTCEVCHWHKDCGRIASCGHEMSLFRREIRRQRA